MIKTKSYIRDGRAPIPERESVSKTMSSIRGKDTKPELFLRKTLWSMGIRGYRIHWKKVPGSPDIAFIRKKIAIFVNGCYWHRCPICKLSLPKTHSDFWLKKFEKNIERDNIKIHQLEMIGWKTIIIWECQLKDPYKKYLEKIKDIVD